MGVGHRRRDHRQGARRGHLPFFVAGYILAGQEQAQRPSPCRKSRADCPYDRDCERREFEQCLKEETFSRSGETPRDILVRGEITQIDAGAERLVLLSCPWYLVHSVAVQSVAELYEWREVGAVSWADLPVYARRAVTAFARGVSRRQSVDMKKLREEQERKSKGGR